MTDNEIIKAFKYCISGDGCNDCCDCSAYQDDKCAIPDLRQKILQLFSRQKAENEQLKIQLQAMKNAANGFKAEVERLEKENELLSENADTAFQNGLNEAQDLYAEQIKSEVRTKAIKEFARKLKENACYSDSWGNIVAVYEINNLVKEMKEEEK